MLSLMQRRGDFDHIVVEASGVSEPQRIMDFARIDPELRADAVIVMIDAANHEVQANDAPIKSIIAAQVSSADLLLLNKTDLVSPAMLAQLDSNLASENPGAQRLHCQQAQLPLEVILGIKPLKKIPAKSTDPASIPAKIFCSASFYNRLPIEKTVFAQFCAALDATVLRGKGVLHFTEDMTQSWIWQKVAQQTSLTEAESDPDATSAKDNDCQLILIAAQANLKIPSAAKQLFEKIELSDI